MTVELENSFYGLVYVYVARPFRNKRWLRNTQVFEVSEAAFLVDAAAAKRHYFFDKTPVFVKTRAVYLLAAVCCFCCGGCMTGSLWSERDYVVPSPDPKLALSRTPQGILVQYDAEYERNGDIHRRAYYLEPNIKRIAAGQKPVFVDPAKAGPQTVIPILRRSPTAEPQPELFALCSSNFCTFSLYRRKQVLGPCDLPVFRDRGEMAKQVALTPLTVAGYASSVAVAVGCFWAWLHASGSAANPDGTSPNFY